MRAQVFSIDFVMASAILLLCLGIALQVTDMAQRNASQYAALQTNNAEAIAANLTAGGQGIPGFRNYTPYCFKRSGFPNENTCGGFSCVGNTHAAIRLVNCAGAPCTIEVRACA
ncbi:MAG: hypothetical protein V1708_05765 [Candidatus Micrarchaeota archaeon]